MGRLKQNANVPYYDSYSTSVQKNAAPMGSMLHQMAQQNAMRNYYRGQPQMIQSISPEQKQTTAYMSAPGNVWQLPTLPSPGWQSNPPWNSQSPYSRPPVNANMWPNAPAPGQSGMGGGKSSGSPRGLGQAIGQAISTTLNQTTGFNPSYGRPGKSSGQPMQAWGGGGGSGKSSGAPAQPMETAAPQNPAEPAQSNWKPMINQKQPQQGAAWQK